MSFFGRTPQQYLGPEIFFLFFFCFQRISNYESWINVNTIWFRISWIWIDFAKIDTYFAKYPNFSRKLVNAKMSTLHVNLACFLFFVGDSNYRMSVCLYGVVEIFCVDTQWNFLHSSLYSKSLSPSCVCFHKIFFIKYFFSS